MVNIKIIIANREIAFNNKEVIVARKTINAFLDIIRKNSVKMNCPSMYFTYLVMMYKKSQEMLEAITPEALQVIMDLLDNNTNDNTVMDAEGVGKAIIYDEP